MGGILPSQMNPGTLSDIELLAATKAGDGPAFGVFYRRRRGIVLAYLSRRTGNPELTADLLAETFATALAAVLDSQREPPRQPVPWLLTIAHNKLTDSMRRRQVEAAARGRLEMEPLPLGDEDLAEIEAIAAETDLLAALAGLLPPDQLAALRARVLDERAYEEIASDLKTSKAVIRKRVSRALRTLRSQMEGST